MDAVREFKRRLLLACPERIQELRLFGSVARGQAHEGSDIDVLVLVDQLDFSVNEKITGLAWDLTCELRLPLPLAPLVMTREHYGELLRRERMIALDIESEGLPV